LKRTAEDKKRKQREEDNDNRERELERKDAADEVKAKVTTVAVKVPTGHITESSYLFVLPLLPKKARREKAMSVNKLREEQKARDVSNAVQAAKEKSAEEAPKAPRVSRLRLQRNAAPKNKVYSK
jgi:hypothetical protein